MDTRICGHRTIRHRSVPSFLRRLQSLIFDQESLFFCFSSSCAVLRSGFPRRCRLTTASRSSSTKAVSQSSLISTSVQSTMYYNPHPGVILNGNFGLSSTQASSFQILPKSSRITKLSLLLMRRLLILSTSTGSTKSITKNFT